MKKKVGYIVYFSNHVIIILFNHFTVKWEALVAQLVEQAPHVQSDFDNNVTTSEG